MKKLASVLIALSLGIALPVASLAADAAKRDRAAWTNTQGLRESSDVIGATVENKNGKNIGKVDALLIDMKDGKVSHAVVGLGGFLGMGKDKVVVPYSALTITERAAGRKATVVADQTELSSAPKYVKTSDRTPAASPRTDRTDRAEKKSDKY
jgi:sporulation protein YlmC with PRC-barrel domain